MNRYFTSIILTIAAFFDMQTKRVPPVLQILLLVLIPFNNSISLSTFVIAFLTFACFAGIALALGGVGGSDTKLSTLTVLCSTAEEALVYMPISFLLFFIYACYKRFNGTESYPYIPFLAVSYIITFIFLGGTF